MNDSVYSDTSSTQNSDVDDSSDATSLTTTHHDASFNDTVTQNPYAPLSSGKKASIIKLEKPVFTVQHSVEISRINPVPTHPTTTTTTITTTKTIRSSEPTPTITSASPNNNSNKNKKESVPWPNFYYELPSLEESSLPKSIESNVAAFGGVASNTVRPFNHSFPWSSTQAGSDYEDWGDREEYQVKNNNKEDQRLEIMLNEKQIVICRHTYGIQNYTVFHDTT